MVEEIPRVRARTKDVVSRICQKVTNGGYRGGGGDERAPISLNVVWGMRNIEAWS